MVGLVGSICHTLVVALVVCWLRWVSWFLRLVGPNLKAPDACWMVVWLGLIVLVGSIFHTLVVGLVGCFGWFNLSLI